MYIHVSDGDGDGGGVNSSDLETAGQVEDTTRVSSILKCRGSRQTVEILHC